MKIVLTAGVHGMVMITVSGAAPELAFVHRWLDNWRGVGEIAEGMHCRA